MPHCNNSQCSQSDALLKCARCEFAFYCSKECQKEDWKAHKADCKSPTIAILPNLGLAMLIDDGNVAALRRDLEKERTFSRLMYSCTHGELLPIVDETLIGSDLINYSSGGETLLLIAAGHGSVAWTQYLLEMKADPTLTSKLGQTPLWRAACDGHLNVVDLLFQRHNNILQAANQGVTPLWTAAFWGHLPVVTYLVDHKAEVNAFGEDHSTPLMASVYKKHHSCTDFLIKNKADVNKANVCAQTPLWIAAKNEDLTMVQMLIANGAKDHQKGFYLKRAFTPLEMAQKIKDDKHVFQYLNNYKKEALAIVPPPQPSGTMAKTRKEQRIAAKEREQLEEERLAQVRSQSALEQHAAKEIRMAVDGLFKKSALSRGVSAWKFDHHQQQEKKWMGNAFFEAKALQRSLNVWRNYRHQKKAARMSLITELNASISSHSHMQRPFHLDAQKPCVLQAPLPLVLQQHWSLVQLLSQFKATSIKVSGSTAIQYFWQSLFPRPDRNVMLDAMKPNDLDLVIDCSPDPLNQSPIMKKVNDWAIDNRLCLFSKGASKFYKGYSLCDPTQGVSDGKGVCKPKELIDITVILSPEYCSNDPIHLTHLRLDLRWIHQLLVIECVLASETNYPALSFAQLVQESYYSQCLEIDPPSSQAPPTKLIERVGKYLGFFKQVFDKPVLGDNCVKYFA